MVGCPGGGRSMGGGDGTAGDGGGLGVMEVGGLGVGGGQGVVG